MRSVEPLRCSQHYATFSRAGTSRCPPRGARNASRRREACIQPPETRSGQQNLKRGKGKIHGRSSSGRLVSTVLSETALLLGFETLFQPNLQCPRHGSRRINICDLSWRGIWRESRLIFFLDRT